MQKKPVHTTERPPIVVVLGHVDHGKSTLLDYIRKTNVALHEAGGITQHVAAYEVIHTPKHAEQTPRVAEKLPRDSASGPRNSAPSEGRRITFIDTPGHAAFRAIRSRGANIADIAILVIAADDGVKAQTLEALESIRAAKIPFIIAINKMDRPNANMERTQAGLMENGVYLEKLGGEVPWVPISAKAGTGIDELLDMVLLVAEMESLAGDPDRPAEGYCIEAHLDQKRGIAATLIITNGSLSQGQAVRIGRAIAPVRIMEDFGGKPIKSATFSSPISLTGFDELPAVGESFLAYSSKRDAEEARSSLESLRPAASRVALTESESERFRLPIIVRADTIGSLEAIQLEASRIGENDARVEIIQSGIGNISEGDVKIAASSDGVPAVVFGFNVGVDSLAQERARQNGIAIEQFDIIYKLVERLEELLRDSAPKKLVEETVGSAKILKCFSRRKDVQVVGGTVTAGHFQKGASVRVFRRSMVVGVGKVKNLQANKKNADRVESGVEFGAQIEAPFEISQGDVVECFTIVSR